MARLVLRIFYAHIFNLNGKFVVNRSRFRGTFESRSEYSTPRMIGEVEPILDVEVIGKINKFVDE